MTRRRLGTVVAILILLLTVVSCDRLNGSSNVASKPTQVVDIPAMIGKSAREITTMVGKPPYRDLKDLGVDWELAEGRLSLSYIDGSLPTPYRTQFIRYELKPDFGIATPEEMAALVNIDFQGRKPDGYSTTRGAFYYYEVNVNGKTLGIDFPGRDGKISGVIVSMSSPK